MKHLIAYFEFERNYNLCVIEWYITCTNIHLKVLKLFTWMHAYNSMLLFMTPSKVYYYSTHVKQLYHCWNKEWLNQNACWCHDFTVVIVFKRKLPCFYYWTYKRNLDTEVFNFKVIPLLDMTVHYIYPWANYQLDLGREW